MSDLIDRLDNLERFHLKETGGSESSIHYYYAEVCHKAAQRILEVEELHGGPEQMEADIIQLTGMLAESKKRAEAFEAALRSIATHGTSQPAALNMPEADWYRGVAFDLIGLAARTLEAQDD